MPPDVTPRSQAILTSKVVRHTVAAAHRDAHWNSGLPDSERGPHLPFIRSERLKGVGQ
jgi:hypothetical protein